MAKRSRRSRIRRAKDRLVRLWGLMSILDFRHFRSPRRMLNYNPQRIREPVGSGILMHKSEGSLKFDENLGGTWVDQEEITSVKILIDEEIGKEPKQFDSRWEGHQKKIVKKGKMRSEQRQSLNKVVLKDGKSCESKSPCQQYTKQGLANILSENDMLKEFCQQNYPNHVQETLCETVKEVLSQQLICGSTKIYLSGHGKTKQLNFYAEEAGFQERRPSDGSEHSQAPNTIIILKPELINSEAAPLRSADGKGRSESITTWSFISNIRRRLKSAISLSKYRLYIDKASSVKADEENHKRATISDVKVSKIYIGAKRYLSEMLSDGNEGSEILTAEFSDKFGRILSLPEFSCSPIGSPKGDRSLTEEVRHPPMVESPREIRNGVDGSSVIPAEEIAEVESSIYETVKDETAITTFDFTNFMENTGESDEFSLENCSLGHLCEASDESEPGKLMGKNFVDENAPVLSPFASPRSAAFMEDAKDLGIGFDKAEQPSPVSVLEPLFAQDDHSPTRTRFLSRRHPIQPLQIEFEDRDVAATAQEINTDSLSKELIIDYVKAVICTFKIDWDELYLRSLSSDQLLVFSLLQEVDFFRYFLFHDKKLLLDCMNEVLFEFCSHYSVLPGYYFSNKINVVRKVSERVYWHLLQPPLPRTLEQIVGKDLTGTEMWLDLRMEAENLGVEMGEIILEEFIQDVFTNCVNTVLESDLLPTFSAGQMEN